MKQPDLRRFYPAAAVIGVALAVAFLARPKPEQLSRYEKTVAAMGTFVTVSAWAGSEGRAEKAIEDALAEGARLEKLLSHFDPASDVSRINDAPAGTPVNVSPETIEVLELSRDISRRTAGAFDVTVGPLVTLWKEAGKSGVMPSREKIAAARSVVSYEGVLVDRAARMVSLAHEGMTLNLSAIAKGYIAGREAAVLKSDGISSGFVNAGGDIAFLGANPDGSPWRAGIADPRDDRKTMDTLLVNDKAVVTSGNYEQYSVIEGKRFSHIIDPRTGMPLEGSAPPASVTTIAGDPAVADAWATALEVLGRSGGGAAADAGVDFLMVFIDDGNTTLFESAGMERYRRRMGQGAARGERDL